MGSPTSNPIVNVQLLPAAIVDAFEDRRDIIFGQTGPTGNATSGALVQNVEALTDAQISALFGDDELYYRIRSWLRGNDKYSPLDVIAVDPNGSGVAATSEIAFTGTATAAGTLTISVVDERLFTFNVQIANGSTAAQVATAVVAAFGNLTNTPPCAAAASVGDVTFTASDVGTIGNYYGLQISGTVAGITYAVTGWASGANDPSLTGILDPIDGRRYTGASWPTFWRADLSTIVDEFDNRFNAGNTILDGVVFHGRHETFANAQTAVSTLNSQSLVVAGNNVIDATFDKGPAILQPADWTLAYFMGVRSKRLTPGAPIASEIIATNAPLDATGGPAAASLPYFNTPLAATPVTLPADLYSATEQRTLEDEGFTTYGVNIAGNAMIMGPAVTTWTTDAAGNENDSFHYLNFVDTASVCREIFFRVLRATYAQTRLTQGDLVAGRSIANAESIAGTCKDIYSQLAALALTQSGREAEAAFAASLSVTINLATGTATITSDLPIVTQLRQINYNLVLDFDITSTGTQITF